MTEHNLPDKDDAPWLNLSPKEVEQLRKSKKELTEYGREKLRKLMTEDDKQFLKEFLTRSGFVGIVVGLFILFIALIGQAQNPPVEQQSTKVVGEYKGCDIIQWYYGPLSSYKYFLYCGENK